MWLQVVLIKCVCLCVCMCACVTECGTGNFPLVPLSLVDKHKSFLKRSLGASHLGVDPFMAQAEPLNLKGFWMENSTLFSFLVCTLLYNNAFFLDSACV